MAVPIERLKSKSAQIPPHIQHFLSPKVLYEQQCGYERLNSILRFG